MKLILRSIVSFAASILMTILVTGALEDRIFFSLFVGIPAGILTFLVIFTYLDRRSQLEPRLKRGK